MKKPGQMGFYKVKCFLFDYVFHKCDTLTYLLTYLLNCTCSYVVVLYFLFDIFVPCMRVWMGIYRLVINVLFSILISDK